MRRDRVGKLLDQRRQFLDFGGERLRGRQSAVDHGVDLDLHRAKPAAEFGELAGKIAGAAGEIGELVAGLEAIVLARGNGVVDRERGEHAERHQRRFGAGEAESQIDHKAERAGDEHHADRDENGADAHHAGRILSRCDSRARMLAVSTSAVTPQVCQRNPPICVAKPLAGFYNANAKAAVA